MPCELRRRLLSAREPRKAWKFCGGRETDQEADQEGSAAGTGRRRRHGRGRGRVHVHSAEPDGPSAPFERDQSARRRPVAGHPARRAAQRVGRPHTAGAHATIHARKPARHHTDWQDGVNAPSHAQALSIHARFLRQGRLPLSETTPQD